MNVPVGLRLDALELFLALGAEFGGLARLLEHVTRQSGVWIARRRDIALHWRERQDYSGMNVMAYGIYTEVIGRWLGDTKRVMADGAVFVRSRIDEETGQPHAIDVPDSLGILARIHEGSRFTFERRRMADGVWLPAHASIDASAPAENPTSTTRGHAGPKRPAWSCAAISRSARALPAGSARYCSAAEN